MRRSIVTLLIAFIFISMAQSASGSVLEPQEKVDKYQNVKEEFDNAVSSYRSARDIYNRSKQELEDIKGKGRLKLLDRAKDFVMHADKAAIRYLESLRSRVQLAQDVPEKKRVEMLAEIDKDIEWLVKTQTDIENAKSIDELRLIAKTVREHWRYYRGVSKRMSGQVLTAKITAMISRGENISTRTASIIEDLKSQGKDTVRLEQLLAEFNDRLSLAKEKNEEAGKQFQEIKSLEGANLTFKESMKLTKEAHRELKEAHGTIVDIGKELKILEGGK